MVLSSYPICIIIITMKRVLIIDTGGTLSHETGTNGALKPGKAPINIVPRLEEVAKVDYKLITRIDSTDMSQEIRLKIVEVIEQNYPAFDGFVITHGTDTMADTACALNYMIQNLGKPIVLTGAQLPIFAPGPDGLNNLYYSVKAATMDIGEVVICFGDRIIRGNCAIKDNVHGFNAFSSPRTPFIGNLGINVKLNNNRIKRFNGNPIFYKSYEQGIEIYTQVSGGLNSNFSSYLDNDDVKGVIIMGYGAGNVQKGIIPYIKQLTEAGKVVVIVTTCIKGSTIIDQYQTGLNALLAGAIEAKGLTIHAASQKMMYALGRNDKNFIELFYENIGRDMG